MGMDIRIDRIETRQVEHPVRQERVVVSHAGRHDRSRFLVVSAHDADGRVGYGEAATTLLWSGEAAETAEWLVREVLAPRLTGARFGHPREALAAMDTAAYGNPFTKAAVEMALWDLWAKAQGVPAVRLFADREPVRAIPTRASIGAYGVAKTLELAREFWGLGIRTLKFKTGVPGDSDVDRLRAVREALGDAPVFTVDYNGAFRDADAAVRSIESLIPFRVAVFEQPTHRDRIDLLAAVKRRVDVPIMADEAIFTPDHLDAALSIDAFDVLSIYPGKNGGFTNALEMARSAHAAGKRCAIGCNLETDLGQAAMASLAAGLSAFPMETMANDLPAVVFYERSSVKQPLAFRDGTVEVPTGPGFGVEPL
jgi:muconate cycloisomerase